MNVTIKNGTISVNGKIIVDGVAQDQVLNGQINVVINGDVDHLEMHSGTVQAQNVADLKTTSGDVSCGDVGSIHTMSGNVDCGNVSGDINTMFGDVIHKL